MLQDRRKARAEGEEEEGGEGEEEEAGGGEPVGEGVRQAAVANPVVSHRGRGSQEAEELR